MLTLSLGCRGQAGPVCAIDVLLTAGGAAKRAAQARAAAKRLTLLKKTVRVAAGPNAHGAAAARPRGAEADPEGPGPAGDAHHDAGGGSAKRYALKLRR